MDGKPLANLCALGRALNVPHGVRQPAALMGAEGVDSLAAEVVVLQKCVDRHRHRAPVVRIAEVNLVVSVEIGGQIQNLRAGFLLQVGLRFGDTGLVILGVRLCLLNFIEPAASIPADFSVLPTGMRRYSPLK